MSATPARSYIRIAIVTVLVAVVIIAAILASGTFMVTKTVTGSTTQSTLYPNPGGSTVSSTSTVTQEVTSSQTTTGATSSRSLCISPGQPGGAFLRVLNGSTSLPVVGANVTAVANGYSGNCGIATVSAFTWQSTYAFTTNSTEWYPLDPLNVDSYQFAVSYLGQTYNYTMTLGPVVYTCGTVYLTPGNFSVSTLIPSGSATPAQSCSQTQQTTSTSPTSPACIQTESEPLFLIIRNTSTGSPIGSVPVQVTESTPNDLCSPTSGNSTKDLSILSTDINGTIEVCCTGSTFFFGVTYLGGDYQITSTAEGAESVQCVTLYIPSGVTNTTFAPQFQDHC
jgi:hypothetical protein